jgi:NADPH:quinone reductase-like Zn-dependent oxidoreductase
VGTFAVQIARALGAQVTAVTSTDKLELVRQLGAHEVVDYTLEDFTKGARRYDLIVEIGGNVPVRSMRRALSPGGRIIIVGAGRGRFGVLGRIIGATIRTRLGQPIKFFVANGPYKEQLATLRELIETGKVRPVIDRTYPLDETAAAMRYVATEQARGKVVITIVGDQPARIG